MAKLLQKPNIIIGENGKPVLEAEHKKRMWRRVVTCGKLSGNGCGSKQEIAITDVFKEINQNPMGTQIGYRCLCLHCHSTIIVKYQETPWHTEEIPEKAEWLKRAADSLIETLYQECDPADRERLQTDLLEDGTDERWLTKYNWS